jgi:amino acid transporter
MDHSPDLGLRGSPSTRGVDEQQLQEFGYKQELPRVLRLWTNWAVGFAYISPIVGLYTVLALNAATAGPSWVWAVVIAATGQLLIAITYTQLAAKWPIAGGIYQWSRQLLGPKYGWWSGWIYMWALIFTLSLVAYGGGKFLAELVGIAHPTSTQTVLFALIIMVVFTIVNMIGLQLLRFTVNIGIACELFGSIGVGIALLVAFRKQPVSVVVDTSFLPHGTSFLPAFVASIAVAGWNFLGFDACGSLAEETKGAVRRVPRAIVLSILSVAAVDIVAAFGFTLAQPDLHAVVNGQVPDPVATAVITAFGPWAAKPFLVIVVISFIACGIAVQGATVRLVYSYARDEMIPGSRLWRRITVRDKSPVYAVLLVAVLSGLAFVYANALTVLTGLATGGYFVAFGCPVAALLYAQLRGRWQSAHINFKRWALPLSVLTIVWVVGEFLNIAWPRSPSLPWYQNWAVELGLGIFLFLGALYYFPTRPDRKHPVDKEQKQLQDQVKGLP